MKPATSSLRRNVPRSGRINWIEGLFVALSIVMLCIVLFSLEGCAATPQQTAGTQAVPFDQAVAEATDGLVAQTQKLPAFMAGIAKTIDKRSLVIDPMIDGSSGEQTVLTRQLEEKVSARLASNYAQLPVLPFQLANLNRSQYVLTGTISRMQEPKAAARAPFQINLALTEIKTGMVIAQASSRARDDGLDTTPTPYYRDSPILVKDKVVDGYIATSSTAPGQPAAKEYFDRLATATTINEATVAYNSDKYQEALDLYKSTLNSLTGEQMRALNGVYLSSWKLGRTADAEQAFGKVVAHGIANSNLGVKFLFTPGSTDFWPDPKVSGPYSIWMRQIARQTAASKACMNIVGHTSRTGGDAYNDKLSAARSSAIRTKLGTESAELLQRTKTSGVGSRENIIGTGTDDASDSLDRRVEFKIVTC